jgi:hypothetical protein
MAKLQRSRKGEEQRRKQSLPKLVRRRCNGGERIEEDPISQQCRGRSGGGVVDEGAGRRRASAAAWSRSAAAFLLCSSDRR